MEQTGCHSREEGYTAFLSSQSPLQRFRLKRHSHRVTDSGNEHRVDALEITSIPCNLILQDKELRKVMHHFDTLTKKESDLEKIVQTMGETDNEE